MSKVNDLDCVSVVIPLYNHGAYIVSALRSIVSQGHIVKEIIVIDDGSQDNSLEMATNYAKNHSYIKIISQKNCGAAFALNRGMKMVTADYVAILNSDDLWMPNRLERLVKALDRDVELDLVGSDILFINDDGVEIQNAWYEDALNNFIVQRDLGLALMKANFLMTTSNFVFRRNLLVKIGDFADLRYAHDMDFGLRIAVNRGRIGFVDEKLLAYRVHKTNTIKESQDNVRVDWAMVASFFLWRISRQMPLNIEYIQKGWQIMESHHLTQAAQSCIRYFDVNPSISLATNNILGDVFMKAKLLSAV